MTYAIAAVVFFFNLLARDDCFKRISRLNGHNDAVAIRQNLII